MIRGSTPTAVAPRIFTLGCKLYFSTASAEAISKAAAPSFTPEALPAVMLPFSPVIDLKLLNLFIEVKRGCSSLETSSVSFLTLDTVTGMISRASEPFCWASCAFY